MDGGEFVCADSIAVYGGEGLADNAARRMTRTRRATFCGQHPAIGDAAQRQPLPV